MPAKGPRIARDCRHPRAKHQHGTVIAYTEDECRALHALHGR